MKVLIAGGAGFIGSHLSRKMLGLGHEVICVDNLLTGSKDNIKDLVTRPGFSFLSHDITRPLPDGLRADAVFHMASPASPNHHSPLSYHALPMETMMANTTGTLELLRFAKRNNASFLFASTSEIYGDPEVHPQPESYRGNTSTTGPRAVYDEAKRFAESLTMAYYRQHGVDTRIVRIFNTYGPRMDLEDGRALPNFLKQAILGQPLTVYGNGQQTRSFCYVDDLIDGIVRLLMSEEHLPVNIGNPNEITLVQFAESINSIVGNSAGISFVPDARSARDPQRRRPDITRARQILGWEPKYSLADGLRQTVPYFKQKLAIA